MVLAKTEGCLEPLEARLVVLCLIQGHVGHDMLLDSSQTTPVTICHGTRYDPLSASS